MKMYRAIGCCSRAWLSYDSVKSRGFTGLNLYGKRAARGKAQPRNILWVDAQRQPEVARAAVTAY